METSMTAYEAMQRYEIDGKRPTPEELEAMKRERLRLMLLLDRYRMSLVRLNK